MQNTAELMGSKNYFFTSKIQYFFSVTKLKKDKKFVATLRNNGFLSVEIS